MNTRLLKLTVAGLAGAAALGGCGSSTSNSTPSTTPAATASTPAASSQPVAPAAGTSKLTLQANPTGALMYVQSSLKASAGTVTIDFENQSSIPHNVTVADSAGKVVGSTPTFKGGSMAVTVKLTKGTYTYFCTVPGHEQAGMKGTLTVS